MVFNVTYRKIQDYNFQHVHESWPLPYRTRRSLHKIRGPKVLSDLCVSTGIGQRPICTQTKVHPAPAFRAFSSNDVSKVVGRLYKNPSSIKRHSLPIVESRHCLSKEEESELSARLMQPTVAAKIRMATLRVKPSESLPDLVRNSCDRLNKGPSTRYYPGCYENVSQRKFSYRYLNGSTSTFWIFIVIHTFQEIPVICIINQENLIIYSPLLHVFIIVVCIHVYIGGQIARYINHFINFWIWW